MTTTTSRAARAIGRPGRLSADQAQANFERVLRRKHGIGRAEYDALLAGQFNACPVCGASIMPAYAQSVQFTRQRGPRSGAARILVLADRLVMTCGACHTAAVALERDAARTDRLRLLLTGL